MIPRRGVAWAILGLVGVAIFRGWLLLEANLESSAAQPSPATELEEAAAATHGRSVHQGGVAATSAASDSTSVPAAGALVAMVPAAQAPLQAPRGARGAAGAHDGEPFRTAPATLGGARNPRNPDAARPPYDYTPGHGCGYQGACSCFPDILCPSRPYHPEDAAPFAAMLSTIRDNLEVVKGELRDFISDFDREAAQGAEDDEPDTTTTGALGWMTTYGWTAVDGWRGSVCDKMPRTCELLKPALPTTRRPLLARCQEQLEIFGMAPQTHIQKHHDQCGGRVGLLVCLLGCDGESWHTVYTSANGSDPDTRWYNKPGDAVIFDPNFQHEAGNMAVGTERWVLSIQVSNPLYTARWEHVSADLRGGLTPHPDLRVIDEDGDSEDGAPGQRAGNVAAAQAMARCDPRPCIDVWSGDNHSFTRCSYSDVDMQRASEPEIPIICAGKDKALVGD